MRRQLDMPKVKHLLQYRYLINDMIATFIYFPADLQHSGVMEQGTFNEHH